MLEESSRFHGNFQLGSLQVQREQSAHCKLCMRDFSIAHGDFNDITRHIKGPIHQQRFKDSSSNIVSMVGQPSQLSHSVQYQFFLIPSWIKLSHVPVK